MERKPHWVLVLTLAATTLMSLVPDTTNSQEKEVTEYAMLADGQFVYGPNVGEFDLLAFLRSANSPLSPYGAMIEDKARYYSINPRVVLAILEIRGGLVMSRDAGLDPDLALGYDDVTGLDEQVEVLSSMLTSAFYIHLYGDPKPAGGRVMLVLRTGELVEIPEDTSAGTVAVLSALAPLSSHAQWQALTSAKDAQGFVQTYRRLFPESDPLDTSNQIFTPTAPPTDLLKFPFACGDTWNFSGGPHDWDGDCVADPRSALDFAPGVAYCTIPTDRWITSPAAGTVSNVSCGGCQVYINHSGGWSTRFYHVANTQVSVGQTLAQDQHVGNPSCKPAVGGSCGECTGSANGTHVHYDLMYNGAFYAIDGTSLEGWTVHAATNCYSGYLQRDGQTLWVGSPVTSEDCGTCCGCLPAACCTGALGEDDGSCSDSRRSESDFYNTATTTLFTPCETDETVDAIDLGPQPEGEEWQTGDKVSSGDDAPSAVTPARLTQPGGSSMEIEAPTDSPGSARDSANTEPDRTPPSSTSYAIPRSVFGGGGGAKSSAHYVMNGTQGQPTDLSRRESASYVLVPGYWGRWIPSVFDNRVYLPLVTRNH